MAASFGVGWRQAIACLFLLASVGMIASTYGVIAVPLGEEFHPSRMVLMLAMTVMAGATAVLSPFIGNLMDRLPLRGMMVVGSGLLAAGYLALSFATTFNQVLVIFGALMAPANVLIGPMAATVLLSRWFVKRRGTALGIAISGIAIGGFVFPLVIQGLLDAFHWREAMRLLSLILLLMTLPAIALIVNHPADRGLHADGAPVDPEPAGGVAEPVFLSARAIISDPTFWLCAAMFAVVLAGMKGMVTNLVPLAVDEGIDASIAAPLISIYAGCGFIAKLGFAVIADRINLRILMLVSIAGFGLGMACMIAASWGYAMIAAGVALIGLFGGLMVPLQSLLIPLIFGRKVVGRASGLINSVLLVGLLSTPPIFGLIFDLTGQYDAIFVAFAGLSLVTMGFVVPYIRLHPQDAASQHRAAATTA